MSKVMKEEKKNLEELMVAIKRNVKPSKCIENFEGLLQEIDDETITNVFINEMSGFISELFELFHESDKIKNLKIKARMLTWEFIKPESYFKESKKLADKIMKYRAAYELYYKKSTPITKDTNRKPVKIKYIDAVLLIKEKQDESISEEYTIELARKVMLLYHHLPAICKALIQTRRRSLRLDNNSRRFA